MPQEFGERSLKAARARGAHHRELHKALGAVWGQRQRLLRPGSRHRAQSRAVQVVPAPVKAEALAVLRKRPVKQGDEPVVQDVEEALQRRILLILRALADRLGKAERHRSVNAAEPEEPYLRKYGRCVLLHEVSDRLGPFAERRPLGKAEELA